MPEIKRNDIRKFKILLCHTLRERIVITAFLEILALKLSQIIFPEDNKLHKLTLPTQNDL